MSQQRMKIVIPGGSGQIGKLLAGAMHGDGHEVVVLSRSPGSTPWRSVPWDGRTLSGWIWELNGADVVVNLAGQSVNCRYAWANRRAIMDSRIESTRVLGEAIARAKRPPRVWLQSSTATIYSHRFDAANDEATGILGGQEPNAPDTWRFSIDVAKAWERTFDEAAVPGTRKVKLRTAILMSVQRGCAFDILLRLARFGFGGLAGGGRQYVSWIHDTDFVRAVRWLIAHDEVEGAVNVASPNPLPNAEFMQTLRRAWGCPVGIPQPRALLEIGAFFLQTETELILKSRRVVPGRLLENGFSFGFPLWPEAAGNLCERWRALHARNGAAPRSAEVKS
jgi:uncharacterized protein (TIGR01777 family)